MGYGSRLAAGEIHLWFLPREQTELDDLCGQGRGFLSGDERARFLGFASAARARRYLLGRILLRNALAHHLARDPGEFVFSETEQGKLVLKDPAQSGLDFSLSHSRTETVLAIARAEGLGIDVEPLGRAATVLKIAHRYFSADERRRLDALGGAAMEEALCLWTLKESVVKAMGGTIWKGLGQVSLDISGGMLSWRRAPPLGDRDDWALALGSYRRDHRFAAALWRPCEGGGPLSWKAHVLGQGDAPVDQLDITTVSNF